MATGSKNPETGLTPKQEAFCRKYVDCGVGADAYRAAYGQRKQPDKVMWEMASSLLARPNVRKRVNFLTEQKTKVVVEQAGYSLIDAMRDARGAYEVAREKGNGGAMTAAATLMSKLYGLLIERREVRTGPLDALEPAELIQIQAAIKEIRTH